MIATIMIATVFVVVVVAVVAIAVMMMMMLMTIAITVVLVIVMVMTMMMMPAHVRLLSFGNAHRGRDRLIDDRRPRRWHVHRRAGVDIRVGEMAERDPDDGR